MISQAKLVKFDELVLDERIANEISKIRSAEELQKVLSANGLELSLEEIGEISDNIAEKLDINRNDEFNEDDLSGVVGGGKGIDTLVGVGGIALGAATGNYWFCAYCVVGIWATWKS